MEVVWLQTVRRSPRPEPKHRDAHLKNLMRAHLIEISTSTFTSGKLIMTELGLEVLRMHEPVILYEKRVGYDPHNRNSLFAVELENRNVKEIHILK